MDLASTWREGLVESVNLGWPELFWGAVRGGNAWCLAGRLQEGPLDVSGYTVWEFPPASRIPCQQTRHT